MVDNGLREPLDLDGAKRLANKIRLYGEVRFRGHARDRMKEHDVEEIDALHAIRDGACIGSDRRRETHYDYTWRYKIQVRVVGVAVTFRSETALTVVTVWKDERRTR